METGKTLGSTESIFSGSVAIFGPDSSEWSLKYLVLVLNQPLFAGLKYRLCIGKLFHQDKKPHRWKPCSVVVLGTSVPQSSC
ncbi:hypothetical protein BDQ17DRAFT_1345530, partial [Cyathus striatus]